MSKKSVSEALKRAQQAAAELDEVGGRVGHVQNTEPGYTYTALDDTIPPRRREQYRARLRRKGWEPISGPAYGGEPRAEFIHDQESAELWRAPDEVIAFWHEREARRFADNPVWQQLQGDRWVKKSSRRTSH